MPDGCGGSLMRALKENICRDCSDFLAHGLSENSKCTMIHFYSAFSLLIISKQD